MNRAARVLAPDQPRLDADALVESAARAAKSDHFGDEGFLAALPVLLETIEKEADLNFIGRIASKQSLVTALTNRFAVYRHRAAHPEIAGVPIEKPVFIVGFPRTGTTLLVNLLAQDPANRTPLGWEVQFPDPPPEEATQTTDPRIAKARKLFAQMDSMAPTLASIHEIGADLPQECMPILAHTLLSPQPNLTFNVPSYQDWVDDQDPAPSYVFHRHFLEHLQSRAMRERWVLKSPVHLATLDALLGEYPDARLIFTHRDPARTIPSVASLWYTVRGIVSDSVDATQVGPEQMRWWADAIDHATEVRRAHPDKADQFIDLQFEELVRDPIPVVERLYQHFDLPWSDDVANRMRTFIAENPRGKHGTHQYSPEDFGLELSRIRDRFQDYSERYDVPLVV